MTSIDNLELSESEASNDTYKLLDEIAPTQKKQTTFYPLIIAIIIAIIAYVVTSGYFTNFFNNVSYLPLVQSGLIFSISLLMILYFF